METRVYPRSRPVRALAVLCALFAGVESLFAQQGGGLPSDPPGVRRMSLADVATRVEDASLELRLARQDLAAAQARAVSAAARPNPGISASREQLSGGGATYYETVLSLGQTLEVGGQRGLRRGVASSAVDAAVAGVSATRLRVAFEVHRAYFRAAAAEADLAVLSEATTVFRQVDASGQVRFAEGDISRFDRGRLQVERLRYENLLASARLALDEASRELTMLVAPDSLAGGGFRILPAQALAALPIPAATLELDAALVAAAGRAELAAADAEIETARRAMDLQRRERVPDVTLSAGFKEQAGGLRGGVLGVSVPVPLFDRNRGQIALAQAELDAAVVRRDLVRLRVGNEVRRAWDTYRSLEERARTLGHTLLPESAGLLQTARVAYAEGEMSLLELLDAADAYRAARESVNQLLRDYLISVYDLERATGRLLTPPATAPVSIR